MEVEPKNPKLGGAVSQRKEMKGMKIWQFSFREFTTWR